MTRPSEADPPDGHEERREVFYWGQVQGVGFRATARWIATQLPLTGLVRNLSDGRVQLVVEGSSEAIDELVERLEGEMGRYIRGKDVKVGPATGEFSLFEVVR